MPIPTRDPRWKSANAAAPISEALKTAYAAGMKSKGTSEDAPHELKEAEHELQESVKQLVGSAHGGQLGAPIGIFANIAAAAWELAYWKGAEEAARKGTP